MIIAHLDMDSFFASVEARENTQFAGLGIVVGADPKNGAGRGVVSTANYQARKYGIHSAMPISTAWRLSQIALKRGEPKTVFLPVNMEHYERVSGRIMDIIRKYVQLVEQTSIDEAYMDLTFCDSPQNSSGFSKAVNIIHKIKSEIKSAEKLTAKVGIGPNKLIAKMASAACRPDDLTVVRPDEVEKFLDPLPIGDIPGIGPRSEEFFHKKKIFKVSDLKRISKDELVGWLGKHGQDIYEKARGVDDSPVTPEHEIKSVSEQETFETDTLSGAFILGELEKLAAKVLERMGNEGIKQFRTVNIVVRFSDFTTKSRAHTLSGYTNSLVVFKNESLKMMLPFLDRRGNPGLQKIRLIGVGIENFGGGEEEKKIIEQRQFILDTSR